jgi:glycosyltransferase involved in cell wall biosynthesis
LIRVCHISSVHHDADARILYKECVSIASAGYDTHFVVTGDRSRCMGSVSVHAVRQRGGGRTMRMSLGALRVYLAARKLRADLYHIHDPELLPFALLLRLGGAAVVYDAHEDLPQDVYSKDWIPRPIQRPLSSVVDFVERLLARRMSAVVATTPSIQQRFMASGCPATLVRNFPIASEFPEGTSRDFQQLVRPDVGYVGDISLLRGSRVMLEAISLTGVDLRLAGRISDEELEALREMPGWARVQYKGYLSRSEVRTMFDGCFAGLVVLKSTAAYRASLPIKLFEYMAAGIPVIASNFDGWRTVVEKFGCGICVDPADPSAIASAICYLDKNRAIAREMGARGREAYQSQFCWKSEEASLLGLYNSLVGRPTRT